MLLLVAVRGINSSHIQFPSHAGTGRDVSRVLLAAAAIKTSLGRGGWQRMIGRNIKIMK